MWAQAHCLRKKSWELLKKKKKGLCILKDKESSLHAILSDFKL